MAELRDEAFMRLAIASALAGVAAGQSPYGAAVARGDELLSCEHNQVLATLDVAAHAEISALRVAGRRLGSTEFAGCTVYSTCEPCAMCFSACHWAHVDRIVFGATIADSTALGFRELAISNDALREIGGGRITVVGGVLRSEYLAIFAAWQAAGRGELY